MNTFDHNGPGLQGKLFGLPVAPGDADLIIIPVPWEVTVTFKEGTSSAPSAILKASNQIDLFHHYIQEAWKIKVALLTTDESIAAENQTLRNLARLVIQSLENGDAESGKVISSKINEACESLNIFIKNQALHLLKVGKTVAVLGGDHSTPLGLLRALSERYDRFGILQLDAHADLRRDYEGFIYSHASIMFNALKLPAISKLVQVGIRDYCEEEAMVIQRAPGRIKTFFDQDLKTQLLEGKAWKHLCEKIIHELPPLVYISFDIDALTPGLCPNTGTPVPGGLEYDQAVYLIQQVVKSGRKIVGFDLCEVGKDEWDANVGARILWELSQYTMASQTR